jgi:hypothetical protein
LTARKAACLAASQCPPSTHQDIHAVARRIIIPASAFASLCGCLSSAQALAAG